MTVGDVEALAAGGESETVELKASTGERVAGAMAISTTGSFTATPSHF